MEQKIKINFDIQRETMGFQAIDALYAYRQSLRPKYQSDIDFQLTTSYDASADVNVLCLYMTNEINHIPLEKYDVILVNNAVEPLLTATPMISKLLELDNCYFLCNSLVTEDHAWKDKIIWYPGNIMYCRSTWTRHFNPQYFENTKFNQLPRDKNLTLINGAVRSWRHYINELIRNSSVDIPIMSNVSVVIHETNDSFFESAEDQEFRIWVNEQYENIIVRNQIPTSYVDNSVSVGINSKFGSYMPGYLLMPEYYTHHCVIFPETTWQNNELAITEKSLKCFYAGSFAWPIGGSNLNKMYNDLGFYTAWNLLPDHLKVFDSIADHKKRYSKLIDAIAWLDNNPQVFSDPRAKDMLQSNKLQFHTTSIDYTAMKKFDEILRKYYD
jgi:hypothetical protein